MTPADLQYETGWRSERPHRAASLSYALAVKGWRTRPLPSCPTLIRATLGISLSFLVAPTGLGSIQFLLVFLLAGLHQGGSVFAAIMYHGSVGPACTTAVR